MLIEGIDGLADAGHSTCIVGSGPIGLAMAADLAARGQRVLVLESGRDAADPRIQSLAAAPIVNPANHDDMMIATARRLGGTSHLWGGRCVPYDPIDFEGRDWVDAQWPIDHAEAAAWWSQATTALRAGSAVFDAPLPDLAFADERFDCSTLERWTNTQQAQVAHRDVIHQSPLLEVRTCATMTAMHYGESGALTEIDVAHSLSGEKVRIKVDRLILATGGIEAARLLLASRIDSPDRFGGPDGALGRYYMGHVSGEIADLEFASTRAADAFNYVVDANGSYVRRRIVPSASLQRDERLLNMAFWPVVPPIFDARHGSAILSMVYIAMRWPAIGTRLVAEAIRKQHAPDPAPPLLPHIRNLTLGAPSAAVFGVDFLRRRFSRRHRMPGFFIHNAARRYGLSYHGEQLPKRESRVSLSGHMDRLGTPGITVDYRVHGDDVASVIRNHELLDDWLGKTGYGKLHYRVPADQRAESVMAQAIHGRHQIGLTRMGSNRRAAIVDAGLATFDAPNVYVASTSVLPTSSQANPTMTAVALGLRLSARLAQEAGSVQTIRSTVRPGAI